MGKGSKLNLYAIVACTATILAASWVFAAEENEDCELDGIEDEAVRVSLAFQLAGFVDNCAPVPPGALLGIKFPTAEVNLGNYIPPARTILPPIFEFEGDATSNYTLAILNKDYPSAAAPILANYLVSLCVNINGSEINIYDGSLAIAPWINVNPSPGAGIQRVVAYLFQQTCYINPRDRSLIDISISRAKFNLTELVANYTLGDPVAGNFWRTSIPKNYENYCGIETAECCARTNLI